MREVNPAGVGGRFISISSIGGYTSFQTISIYNAAKFGELFLSSTSNISLTDDLGC